MFNSDLIIGFFGLIFAAVIFAFTRNLSQLSGVFINYVLIIIFVLSIIIVIKGFIHPEKIKFFKSVVERNNVLVGIAILLLYLIVIPIIGFLPASYLFYVGLNIYLAEKRWSLSNIFQSIGLSAAVVTLFYMVFYYVLSVPLPKGIWFDS